MSSKNACRVLSKEKQCREIIPGGCCKIDLLWFRDWTDMWLAYFFPAVFPSHPDLIYVASELLFYQV
jgi:hypothetical protein